jgi:hypothetical protein
VESPADRCRVPLESRQPNVGRIRLEAGHRGLRGAHTRGNLGLRQAEFPSAGHEAFDELSPPLGHLSEPGEYGTVARSAALRIVRSLHIEDGISKEVWDGKRRHALAGSQLLHRCWVRYLWRFKVPERSWCWSRGLGLLVWRLIRGGASSGDWKKTPARNPRPGPSGRT